MGSRWSRSLQALHGPKQRQVDPLTHRIGSALGCNGPLDHLGLALCKARKVYKLKNHFTNHPHLLAQHTSTFSGSATNANFSDHRYSRRHVWQFDGGAVVPASSSPHVVPLPFSDPTGVDPEEAFVAALSSCHMLWFLDIAARAGWVVDSYRGQGRGHHGAQRRRPAGHDPRDAAPGGAVCGGAPTHTNTLHDLHHRAHTACFIANSVKTEVLCQPVFETATPAQPSHDLPAAPL